MFPEYVLKKSLLKPLEIAVFTLKMTYFVYENGPRWAMHISKLDIFKDIGREVNKLSELCNFFDKSLKLVMLFKIELCLFLYPE